tara:strand:+ start:1081 stop:1929 length:849 start_codon:yes stop_codon:yes gene_type:complete
MKNHSFLISLITILGATSTSLNQSAYSAGTILNCKGQIPNKISCLISPSLFKVAIYRIDLCKENPFPNYRSSADYGGSGCISLFNNNGRLFNRLFRENFTGGKKHKIPRRKNEGIEPGLYNYLTIVFKNSFISSGKYSDGERTWMTGGVNKKTKQPILKINEGSPVKYKTKLTNWRGTKDLDNDYCENNGGTSARCEIKYNGQELTVIGLGDNKIEAHGAQLPYVFYMNKLLSPLDLEKDLTADFYLNSNTGLEVFGDGSRVKSITIAPFMFKATYKNIKTN